MTVRIIPRLDIKGPNLVKGIHLEGLRVLGRPENFARYYYAQGADELLYIDAVASLYGRNSLLNIVERTAQEIFIPLTVGGGLRSIDDIRTVLRAGADKVALNTAAVANPDLIRQAAEAFGSSTVVVSIQAQQRNNGSYECLTDYGRERTGRDALEWAVRAVEAGAGELLVTSIDREGTGKGFDIDLIRRISSAVTVPVIAAGGAGRVEHVVAAIRDGGADAVTLGAMLHYHAVRHRAVVTDADRDEGNTEFLASGRGFSAISDQSIADVKRALAEHGIECRPAELEAA
jgi:imidazole glycerol-phosphate synthase subunit HisF